MMENGDSSCVFEDKIDQAPSSLDRHSEKSALEQVVNGDEQQPNGVEDVKQSEGVGPLPKLLIDSLRELAKVAGQAANLGGSYEKETENTSPKDTESVDGGPAVCTVSNWESFLPFRRYSANDQYVKLSIPGKEDRKTGPILLRPTDAQDDYTDSSLFDIYSRRDDLPQLEIYSMYLQRKFRDIIEIPLYSAIALYASCLTISPPYVPLFHHLDELKENIFNDPNLSSKDRNSFQAICNFFTFARPQKLFEDVQNIIEEGFIIYREMWALYRPGDYVVSHNPLGSLEISQVSSVKYERDTSSYPYHYYWYVTTKQLAWTQKGYQLASMRHRIESFEGAKRIVELEFCPISRYPENEKVKERVCQRGRNWKQYCEGRPMVMTYKGQALSLIRDSRFQSRRDEVPAINTVPLSATVIVDSDARSKLVKQADIDNREVQRYADSLWLSDSTYREFPAKEFNEEIYMICPASIIVFSLEDHGWYSVETLKLEPKLWRPAAFDRLVIDPNKKDILRRLAKTNLLVEGASSNDVIDGKGKGIVLLLHGPPGVGKTLTAEVLSELTQKPLLKVNLGRVASQSNWEQALEQVFHNAETWKAILLIDEAEIVLEKRTFERMTQNAWISVFLRKLEYYKGLIILTTNLIECIDSAFESRISYPIEFRELNATDRHQIWTDFIKNLKMPPPTKRALLEHVDDWAAEQINGRQIRNIISMAENLALSDEHHPRITPDHVEKILNVVLEFSEFNRKSSLKKKKDYLAY